VGDGAIRALGTGTTLIGSGVKVTAPKFVKQVTLKIGGREALVCHEATQTVQLVCLSWATADGKLAPRFRTLSP
jgi:hypothetical protein